MVKQLTDKIADRVRMGYLAAFLLLLTSYILTFTSTQKLIEQAEWVNQTSEVIHSLDNVLGFITRTESSFRGYLSSGSNYLLSDYRESRHHVDSVLRKARLLTKDNPRQQKNFDKLTQLMNGKFQGMDAMIAGLDSADNFQAPLSFDEQLVLNLATIENQIQLMQSGERNLLIMRSDNVSKYSNTIKVINILSIILAIVFTIYSIFTFNQENKAKLVSDQQARDLQAQLHQRVDDLAAMNVELIELRNIEKFAVTGRISRTIAHEVRNPLTNINLAVEHLRSEVPPNEETNMLFEMVTRNTERINQLISDLLNSTRTSELQFVQATINEVLDRSLEFAMDRIELKKIKIVKDYDPDICPILVNNEKIYIAFLNIIVNAIEAMNQNGTLYLTTENVKNRCVAKITDTGKGMSKGDVGRLFEPYFTTKEKGHGLGLTNTQNIILSHNANITAESEPGKGTTFIISFSYA